MKDVAAIVVVIFGLLVFFCGGWVFSSCNEAAVYTRLTGKEVSTWDAMWVQLRVIEPAEKN